MICRGVPDISFIGFENLMPNFIYGFPEILQEIKGYSRWSAFKSFTFKLFLLLLTIFRSKFKVGVEWNMNVMCRDCHLPWMIF